MRLPETDHKFSRSLCLPPLSFFLFLLHTSNLLPKQRRGGTRERLNTQKIVRDNVTKDMCEDYNGLSASQDIWRYCSAHNVRIIASLLFNIPPASQRLPSQRYTVLLLHKHPSVFAADCRHSPPLAFCLSPNPTILAGSSAAPSVRQS